MARLLLLLMVVGVFLLGQLGRAAAIHLINGQQNAADYKLVFIVIFMVGMVLWTGTAFAVVVLVRRLRRSFDHG